MINRRLQRVSNLIRNTVGELLLSKVSDPRIDPARTSITRVEVADDMLTAKVYISVLGTESQQRLAIEALRHAAGHIQELMARQVQLRYTPVLTFVPDRQFKKTLETLEVLRKVSEELKEKDLHRAGAGKEGEGKPSPPAGDASEQDSPSEE